MIQTILRLSNPSQIQHYVCQVRPLEGKLDEKSIPSLKEVFTLNLEGRWTRSPAALPAALRLFGLIRDLKPHVVHLHTGSSLIAIPSNILLRRRLGWLFDLHEPIRVRHSALTTHLVGAMARNGWCVTHSHPVTEEVTRTMSIPEDRLTLVPLGIDLSRFTSPDLARLQWRTEFGLSPEKTTVITVGRVSEMKGIGRLLDVAAEIRSRRLDNQIQFAVAGGVAKPDEIRALIRARGLEELVHLLGFVEDLPSALNAADIYFAPSTYEGFGLAVAEAMAAGLPVVASAVGGLNDVVQHGKTGYLVANQELTKFVQHLEMLHENREHRQELGEEGRRRSNENFDERRMVKSYEQIYRELARRFIG